MPNASSLLEHFHSPRLILTILIPTMSSKVQLYVYDLSNGMARQLSRQLTGRQIDGIWLAFHISLRGLYSSVLKRRHTSVVVFGKEIFYGQGISTTGPGQSHVRSHLSANASFV